MSKTLSIFSPLDGVANVWSAETKTLRCIAFRLKDEGLCLYSPVAGLGPDTIRSLSDLGEVRYLFAPNHYHNKALLEYHSAFPTATLLASAAATPRLEIQTGLSFQTHEELLPLLLPNMSLLEPAGLKTGEIWVDIVGEAHRACIVTDAFKGRGKSNAAMSKEIELLGTFPKFGIKNLKDYSNWFSTWVESAEPDLIVPCHGAMAVSPDLSAQALSLLHGLSG